ncbi:MAG TPA: HDOD domain-containing protein [Gaiellaceae bacterium]
MSAASISEPDRGEILRERLVELALSLPLGNQAALARLAVLCDDPTVTAQGAALEAARDESFTALLLKLANSAHSMSVNRISDLPAAIARLGFRLVQGLAIAAPGLRLLAGPNDGLGPARHELHRHAVRVGLAARMLAPATVDPERALTAGLLHNLGLNVISLYSPTEFRLLLQAAERGEEIWPLEEELFGFSHAELGALLAERWSFPLTLVEAIRDHDSPNPANEFGWLVQVSDILVRSYGVGVEAPRELPNSLPEPAIGLERAQHQLRTLLEAQDRLDARMDAEREPPPTGSPAAFAEALDRLR